MIDYLQQYIQKTKIHLIFWKKIAGLPESKIVKISTSDNFWSMGIQVLAVPALKYFDHGDKSKGGPPG